MKMKVHKIAAVTIVAMLISLIGFASTVSAKTFSDVPPGYWAKGAIDYLTGREVINGYTDGRFGINDTITREQAAAIIIRSLGWDVSGSEDAGYPDVSRDHWAYDEIATMKHAGFFAPVGSFEPRKPVTRAEMAEMIVNTFDLRSTSGARFTDLDREHPSYDAINILATNQITTGYADGSFRPDQRVSRSEFAMFVARALDESFRPAKDPARIGKPIIYDIEIGEAYVQLNDPLLLDETWLAPVELFTNMGYIVEQGAAGVVYMTTPEGIEIQIQQGAQEVWVGDTLVELTVGYQTVDGQLYIEASTILRTLDKPLVFYPEQRLIRIESPRITVADIKAGAPDTILTVVHEELPYWQWAKRDHDYLLKLQQNGLDGARKKLLAEIRELTSAFYTTEQEKTVVRGLNYYADHVTGKLDAITRGLEARYLLLYELESYKYPSIGKSGALGVFGYLDDHEHHYTVADFSYDHYDERKQELIQVIESHDMISFEQFRGLNIFGAPFTIIERLSDGSTEAWSGKAIGSDNMLVSGSSMGTFIHEFGHNWDAVYGDQDEYLAIRGKVGYTPESESWGERIQENFAEDFVQAFLPAGFTSPHKADFGRMTEEEKLAFIDWAKAQEQEIGDQARTYMTVNGASIMPEAMLVPDGELHVEGIANNVVHVWMQNIETGQVIELEIPSYGAAYDQVIELPEPGVYHINIGSFNMKAIYLAP